MHGGEAWNDHLVAQPAHKAALFDLFVADHPERRATGQRCDALERVVGLWQEAERGKYGAAADHCAQPLMMCPCGLTFCVEHAIACGRCGRFACLRHRTTKRCPECTPGRAARSVAVPRHDPFTKETKLVFRRYVRPGRAVWPRVVPPPQPAQQV